LTSNSQPIFKGSRNYEEKKVFGLIPYNIFFGVTGILLFSLLVWSNPSASLLQTEDAEKLEYLNASVHALERLEISSERLDLLRKSLLGMEMGDLDRFTSEIVYKLQSNTMIRKDFNEGKIGIFDIIKLNNESVSSSESETEIHAEYDEDDNSVTEESGNNENTDVTIVENENDEDEDDFIVTAEINEDLISENDETKNLLMTTYFTHQRDPLGRATMRMNLTIVYTFLSRTQGFIDNMHVVLFVDWKHIPTDTPIEFIPVDFQGVTNGINDYRYFLYRDYLLEHEQYDRILTVDFKDVKYGRDPFELMASMPEKKLFVGSEPRKKGAKYLRWMGAKSGNCFGGVKFAPQRIRNAYHTLKVSPEDYIFTNAGIFGGDRQYVIEVLDWMVGVFEQYINGTNPCNSNMIVFCGAIYPYYQQDLVFTGAPLHSPFRSYMTPTPEYAIFHK